MQKSSIFEMIDGVMERWRIAVLAKVILWHLYKGFHSLSQFDAVCELDAIFQTIFVIFLLEIKNLLVVMDFLEFIFHPY
jgi:hypothetical protein